MLGSRRRDPGLRGRDWRFLLDSPDGGSPVTVIGFPTRRRAAAARRRLGGSGSLVCRWRLPRLFGVQRARRNLLAAGFHRVQAYWPGPSVTGAPEFWLPVEVPGAITLLLASRPARSPAARLLRLLWRLALRTGGIAPVCAVAQPAAPAGNHGLPIPDAWLLLTPGNTDMNKVIGIPFSATDPGPPRTLAKFARVDGAEVGIEWEARMLGQLERELPGLRGLPRLRATGRRGGRAALLQTYAVGRPLDAEIAAGGLSRLAPEVTRILIELARVPADDGPGGHRAHLVEEPLRRFEDDCAGTLPPSVLSALRRRLQGLATPAPAFEHGDVKPWNLILTESGPVLIDWEDAEPRGLPGTDLAFFLASAALLADGAISHRGAPLDAMLASQRRLLDPTTDIGTVAARCVSEYCAATGLARDDYERLRLLGWVRRAVQASDGGVAPDDPSNPFRREFYLGLIEAELDIAAHGA